MSNCDHPEAYQSGGDPCPMCADLEELEQLRKLSIVDLAELVRLVNDAIDRTMDKWAAEQERRQVAIIRRIEAGESIWDRPL